MERPAPLPGALTAPTEAVRSPWRFIAASNALTYASVCSAVAALWFALVARSAAGAGAAIAIAVLADTFDGAFARRFERSATERAFGAQLDSLADAVVSGCVPPVVLLSLAHDGVPPAAWLCAAAWMVAAVTRLGFYNLADGHEEGFRGLPTPVAALSAATALLWPLGGVTAAMICLAGAGAMVAGIPIPRPRGRALLVFAAWPVLVTVLHLAAARGGGAPVG